MTPSERLPERPVSLSRRVARRMLQRTGSIPEDVLRKTRLHMADTVGIALAGSATELADAVARAFTPRSHGGECTVLGSSQRAAPHVAAFCNSALAHLLDFDDVHDVGRLHLTAVTLPAALAVAEHVEGGSRRVVDAVACGNELMCRLALMYSPRGEGPGSQWFLTQLFGYFGAALAAGITLGLCEDDIVSTLGLAYMQAAGGKEAAVGVGSNARAIYPAFAAMGGVTAALLADAGVRGPESALDGRSNLFRTYLGPDVAPEALAALVDGEQWRLLDAEVKLYPSCRLSHPYVATALALRKDVAGAHVECVVAKVNASAAKLCTPLDQRRRPATLQDAKYSIPFMIAFAFARGRVDLTTLDERALGDPAVLDIATRVVIDECLADNPGQPAAEILIESSDGAFRRSSAEEVQADSEQVRAKFVACLDRVAPQADAEALWRQLIDPAQDIHSLLARMPCVPRAARESVRA